MTKFIYENEQIKRSFFEHLTGAQGFTKSTIHTCADAISQWQVFSGNEDFGAFNKTKAIAFVEWLQTKSSKGKSGKLSIVTQYSYLRRIKKFFEWLCEQPGYKSKILKNDIDFLRLSKKDARIAQSGTKKIMPTFEEVKQIITSINIKSDIDRRDRALICFALITGSRISAIISLKMKSFDKMNKTVDQNPADGVKTKNSKRIFSTFFPIGWDDPANHFMEWYEYLESKGFTEEDPLFPSTLNQIGISKHTYSKELLTKDFWRATGAARKIIEKRCKQADLPYFHPHSFRHLVVNILSKKRLTEEEKRAISLTLGHENVGTTFGSYGYGSMSDSEAVKIVQNIQYSNQNIDSESFLSDEEKIIIEKLARKLAV